MPNRQDHTALSPCTEAAAGSAPVLEWVASAPGLATQLGWRVGGNALTIEVRGDMCTASAPLLLDRMCHLLDEFCPPNVKVDLGGVTFADARGVSAVVQLQQRCARRGSTFDLGPVSPAVERLLGLCGCKSLLPELSNDGKR